MFDTAPFIETGVRLRRMILAGDQRLTEAVARSCRENPWFTAENILLATDRICECMLKEERLKEWLSRYPGPVSSPLDVGIVMAGNIPLVGFHDLLCVLVGGHRAWVRPSSKDRVMTEFVVDRLKEAIPSLPVGYLTRNFTPDAVIATGSDLANRYFRQSYGDIPRLLRGNRTSVAILTGDETDEELSGLVSDVFLYFGLGCRNVSRLFVPAGYGFDRLLTASKKEPIRHTGYENAYRQVKAVLRMRNEPFIDGGYFTLRNNAGSPENLPDILYTEYDSPVQVKEWIAFNKSSLQCVVCRDEAFDGSIPFGKAQSPGLDDYADGRDTMDFLLNL